MKKVLALILAVLMIFTVVACGEKTSDTSESSSAATTDGTADSNTSDASEGTDSTASTEESYLGKTLTIAVDSEPDSLVVQTSIPFLGAMYPLACLYAKLYEYDENDEYSPCLATGYEWIDDTHYELYLREDAYAVNGDQITAEDVIYSFKLGTEGTNAKSYTTYDVDNCVAKDEFTVVMALAEPSPTSTDMLYDVPLTIVSKSGMEAAGGMAAAARDPSLVTTGRYKFVEWKEGQYILLQYNDNYFGHNL